MYIEILIGNKNFILGCRTSETSLELNLQRRNQKKLNHRKPRRRKKRTESLKLKKGKERELRRNVKKTTIKIR